RELTSLDIAKLDAALLRDALTAAAKLPRLRHLTLVDFASDPGIFRQIGTMKKLRHLKLDGTRAITKDEILELKNLPDLNVLELESLTTRTAPDLLAVLELPSLKSLRLCKVPETSPEILARLQQRFPDLRSE